MDISAMDLTWISQVIERTLLITNYSIKTHILELSQKVPVNLPFAF